MHSNVVRGLLKPWTTAALALFSIIFQTFTAERRALQWWENEFCLHLQSGKWWIEIHVKKEMCGVPKKKNKPCSYAASLRLRGHLDETTQRIAVESFRGGFRLSFPIFFDQLITWEPKTNLDWRRQFKMKKTVKIEQLFLRVKASRLAFLLARAIVARCKRNYPKTRHQNKLRHHWTDLAAN